MAMVAMAMLETYSQSKEADKATAEHMLKGVDESVLGNLRKVLWRRGYLVRASMTNNELRITDYGEKALVKARKAAADYAKQKEQ